MNYMFIEDQELSKADFAAILQFDREADAIAAAKAINESAETNSPGTVSEGNTGAFRVGRCVVFNAYSETCYGKLIKLIEDLESPAEPGDPAVDSLAAKLWDGMYDKDRTIEDDMEAAVNYIRAMFPEADNIRQLDDCVYFDYDGGKYFVRPEYSIGAGGKVYYGKLTVHDYDSKMEPVTIDRDTDDVKGTLEKFFKKVKPAGDSKDSSVETLARTLWDGMVKLGRKVHVDRDAAIAYFRAMFPEAETSVNDVDSFYFDYCGVEYTMVLAYDRDENDELHGGKIIVHDSNSEPDSKSEPVTINCLTRDVKGTLEKFFKKAKSAGDSKKSSGDSKKSAGDSPDSLAAKLWDRMADPDVDGRDDTDAAIAYLEAVLPRADIHKAGSDSIQLEYKGMKYIVALYYFHGGEGGGYLQFYNKQSGIVDIEIDRDTENPGEQVRKLFEFTTKASLMDRLDKLDAEIKTLNAEIRKIKKTINK